LGREPLRCEAGTMAVTALDAAPVLIDSCAADTCAVDADADSDVCADTPTVVSHRVGPVIDAEAASKVVADDDVAVVASHAALSSRKGVACNLADEISVCGACMIVESDDDGAVSSSSSSSTTSRSRRGQKRLGAAAAAALVTASEPLDVDEADRVVKRQIELPTALALQLQHEGDLMAIMAETAANIRVEQLDAKNSVLSISGASSSVGRAAWQVQQLQASHEQKDGDAGGEKGAEPGFASFKFPHQCVSAVVGHDGRDLPAIRKICGDIMIALSPPSSSEEPWTACIGPGDASNLQKAVAELTRRLEAAKGLSA